MGFKSLAKDLAIGAAFVAAAAGIISINTTPEALQNNEMLQSFTSQEVIAETPADIEALGAEFISYQVDYNLSYNEFDRSHQPVLDGMEKCWQVQGETLTYVLKVDESYYATVVSFDPSSSTGGVNEVVGSGSNSARWDNCQKGTTAAM